MKRRDFLKLSAVTTVGAIIPFTLINAKDIPSPIPRNDKPLQTETTPGDFILIRLHTNKGNANFKLPAKKDVSETSTIYKSIKSLIFEPTENIIVYRVQVLSPMTRNWLDSPFPSNPIYALKGDAINFVFNPGILRLSSL